MREPWALVLAFAFGLLLGAVFFGGLWLTVRLALFSRQTGLWFLLSLLARTSIALGGFYLVARNGWEGMLPCFLGFLTARAAVTWSARTPTPCASDAEAGRAS